MSIDSLVNDENIRIAACFDNEEVHIYTTVRSFFVSWGGNFFGF